MEKLTPTKHNTTESYGYVGDYVRALPGAIVFAVVTLAQAFGWEWVVDAVRQDNCPPSTFLRGSLNDLSFILALIGSASLTFFYRYWFLRWWRGTTKEEARKDITKHVIWSYMALGVAAVTAMGSVASHSQFCLTPEHILIKNTPWAKERVYAWNDVVAIWPSCQKAARRSRGGPHWNGAYQLVLNDNRTLNIFYPVTTFEAAYPHLSRALALVSPQPYFSAQYVEKDCGYRRTDLLLHRP
ncbi:MAG: hypothetical protein RJB58_1556 [Pseudomonadota bacterium]